MFTLNLQVIWYPNGGIVPGLEYCTKTGVRYLIQGYGIPGGATHPWLGVAKPNWGYSNWLGDIVPGLGPWMASLIRVPLRIPSCGPKFRYPLGSPEPFGVLNRMNFVVPFCAPSSGFPSCSHWLGSPIGIPLLIGIWNFSYVGKLIAFFLSSSFSVWLPCVCFMIGSCTFHWLEHLARKYIQCVPLHAKGDSDSKAELHDYNGTMLNSYIHVYIYYVILLHPETAS